MVKLFCGTDLTLPILPLFSVWWPDSDVHWVSVYGRRPLWNYAVLAIKLVPCI